MINFYINRGGKGLSANKKQVLERAKNALRRIASRDKGGSSDRSHSRKRSHGS